MGKNLERWQQEMRRLWEEADIPFGSFLEYMDYLLMKEFSKDASGILWTLFFYFDTIPGKPLTPRELLQFWGALTEEERLFVMLEFT
uniref:Tail assembly chaperone n=1 Tax=Streptomyces phage Scarif TaxID=3158858 RepID=A0AAU7GZY5_9CAUD